VVRELEALREMTFSLITERRRHPPPGAHGGQPAARGRNLLLEGDADPGPTIRSRPPGRDPMPQPGSRELPGKVTGVLRPGQRLRIETPGGGGDGLPETASR
jgi:N-methylhydantoinase B